MINVTSNILVKLSSFFKRNFKLLALDNYHCKKPTMMENFCHLKLGWLNYGDNTDSHNHL